MRSKTVPAKESKAAPGRPTPKATAASAQVHRSLSVTIGLALVSALMLWASFPPLDWWMLAWIAPVPWLLLVRAWPKPPAIYWISYAAGLVFWLASIQWMRLGDPTMYWAWVAMSIYLALGVVVFVALCRQGVHGLGLPLTLVAPIVWVGLELARAHLLSGFAWYFLAHTQYRWLSLIQISDLVGAYGISFVMMMAAGAVAELVPARWITRCGLSFRPSAVEHGSRPRTAIAWRGSLVIGLMALTLVYGAIRLGQADFRLGPKVALIQGDVPQSVKHDESMWVQVYKDHLRLTQQAAPHEPDLVIWPETMFRWPLVTNKTSLETEQLLDLLPESYRRVWEIGQSTPPLLAEITRTAGAPAVIGIDSVDFTAHEYRQYNSAALVNRQGQVARRYDKLHLVPFGEYLPLADTLPWLLAFTPFEQKYGLDAGSEPVVFELDGHHFATLICYEDTVPHLVRRFVATNRDQGLGIRGQGSDRQSQTPQTRHPNPESRIPKLDFLVNLTNDGWFHGSSELEQHLITSAFRAVECRTPLVRAVNTGISAIIDGNGCILPDKRTGKQLEAVIVGHVPLDSRQSFYVRWGDWFAAACLWGCVGLVLSAVLQRVVGLRAAS